MIGRHSVLAHLRQCPRLRHDPRQCPCPRWSSVSRSKLSAAHCSATPHKRECPRLPHDPHKRQYPRLRHDPHPRQCPCLPFDPYRRQKGQDRNVDICRVSKDPVRRGHMARPSPTSDSTAKRSSTTWSSSTHARRGAAGNDRPDSGGRQRGLGSPLVLMESTLSFWVFP